MTDVLKTIDNKMPGESASSPTTKKKKDKKRLSVERIYQKKTQREHILLRPDAYIGSTEPETRNMWIWDDALECIVQKEITFVPGLYKIFDEILVNAADNKQRDENMDTIKIVIDKEKNLISIWNNGKGIPIEIHKEQKVYVPSLIFGQLLTSSNYDDTDKKVTGGRNGFGAKLCNIFSTKFTVETVCKEYGKKFKQVWKDNMTKSSEPNIIEFSGRDYTHISYHPDLSKFHMEELSDDMIALLKRRAYDIAGTSRGVSVVLNGKKLKLNNFKEYVNLYLKGSSKDDGLTQPKIVHEIFNPRWEIAVTVSDAGFQQFSFVNSIATSKGGSHINHVVDQIVEKMMTAVKRKTSKELAIKPFQIKNHIWIFVNCLIENPTFDSQTKENMTLRISAFGSKCALNEKFVKLVQNCGIMESIMNWVKFKTQEKMNKKCYSTKHSKLKGIPKLDDANDAGGKHSRSCTLILTEGDSAKTLAVSGLGVIGRDKYGVFPLRGKVLNVRDAPSKQIMENAELTNLVKIMGLQYKKKYTSEDDLKSLRYGHIMIMTDQDQDGSHIKGLLINFIHHNWPDLLRMNFLEQFITPIVKVTKGNQEKSFFSMPEYIEWKLETANSSSWRVKYYKGLGTSTSKEAKEYFSDMRKHRILFDYNGPASDQAIEMAFSKKMAQDRKDWLTNGMEERTRRKQLGMPEIYLYEKGTERVSYSDFVNKELILYSNADNERSIPSLIDGLKPGSRKVMFTCFKRNDKREVKVAQLAGSIAELSCYHHGETSLMGTIVNLAQNFVGSNNLNLLQPIGQFGTRLHGGKDSASPRYIFTMLSPLARLVFPAADDHVLKYLMDDNQKIEPEWYCPIIPMVLINGAEGIGTGYSTKIQNYDVREVVENIKRMLAGEEPETMVPSFKNFRGSITPANEHQRFTASGIANVLDEKTFEITELPVRTWTQAYKENLLEPFLYGTEKIKACITDYKEYHTDATVHYTVTMTEENLALIEHDGLAKKFKLETSLATSCMVLHDARGCLKKYEDVLDIMREFYTCRYQKYYERKEFLEMMLQAECSKLENQARFILEKIEGHIILENRGKRDIVTQLVQRGYQSDPVKAWKNSLERENADNESQESQASETGSVATGELSGPDFHYLLNMNLLSLSKEKKEELLKTRDAKRDELEVLKGKTTEDLWTEDLDAFMEQLDVVEAQEREDINAAGKLKGKGNANKLPAKRAKQTKIVKKEPAPAKKAKVVSPKKVEEKKKAVVKNEDDNDVMFDENSSEGSGMLSLAERLAAKKVSVASMSSKSKQSTLSFGGDKKKAAKRKNDSDDDDSFNLDLSDSEVARKPLRKKATKKYTFDDEDDDEDADIKDFSDEDSAFGVSDNDDNSVAADDDFVAPKKKTTSKPAAAKSKPKEKNIVDDFDSGSENSEVEATKALIEKLTPKKTAKSSTDNDSEEKTEEKPETFNTDLLDMISTGSEDNDDIQVLSQKSAPKATEAAKKKGSGKTKSDSKQTTLFGGVAKSPEKKPKAAASKKTTGKPSAKPKTAKPKGASKVAAKKTKSPYDSSDDDDFGSTISNDDSEKFPTTKPKTVKPKTVKPKTAKPKTAKPKTATKAPSKKKSHDSSDDDDNFGDDDGPKTAKPKTAKPKTAAKSKKKSHDSSDDDDDNFSDDDGLSSDNAEPTTTTGRRAGTGRARAATAKYVFSDSSDENGDNDDGDNDDGEPAPKKAATADVLPTITEKSWVISDDSDFDDY